AYDVVVGRADHLDEASAGSSAQRIDPRVDHERALEVDGEDVVAVLERDEPREAEIVPKSPRHLRALGGVLDGEGLDLPLVDPPLRVAEDRPTDLHARQPDRLRQRSPRPSTARCSAMLLEDA